MGIIKWTYRCDSASIELELQTREYPDGALEIVHILENNIGTWSEKSEDGIDIPEMPNMLGMYLQPYNDGNILQYGPKEGLPMRYPYFRLIDAWKHIFDPAYGFISEDLQQWNTTVHWPQFPMSFVESKFPLHERLYNWITDTIGKAQFEGMLIGIVLAKGMHENIEMPVIDVAFNHLKINRDAFEKEAAQLAGFLCVNLHLQTINQGPAGDLKTLRPGSGEKESVLIHAIRYSIYHALKENIDAIERMDPNGLQLIDKLTKTANNG